MSAVSQLLARIPKQKPRKYPSAHEQYRWIGEAMMIHA